MRFFYVGLLGCGAVVEFAGDDVGDGAGAQGGFAVEDEVAGVGLLLAVAFYLHISLFLTKML